MPGEREMMESISQWNQKKLNNFMTQRDVICKFNPLAVLHFGGSCERLIQTAKSALGIVLKKVIVTDEPINFANRSRPS